MYPSIWEQTSHIPAFPHLEGNMTTDVLVIGGGMAGLLCAYRLRQAGVQCALVEADTICSGITKNTTAKLTSQHGLIYHKIAKRYGLRRAGLYLEANERALEQFRVLCRGMDCGYERQPNYVYSMTNENQIRQELAALKKLEYPARMYTKLPLPFHTAGAVRFDGQAQFHPLEFVASIVPDLKIYEHTKVRQLQHHQAITDHGTITANKIIVATHFPMLNKHGLFFLKLYQHRSYVLALENAPNMEGMYVDDALKGMSFRNYDNLLLIGGGDHRTGKRGGGWKELSDFAHRHWPQSREVTRWAAQDCMTLDGLPYVGQYSPRTADLYVATGFNKWGMTNAMAAAGILTDLVQGKTNPYAEVYSPSRTILHPLLLANAGEAVMNLLTPTAPRCPHMGCALKYNKQEHTWDCPCHGSRFTRSGELIDGPAADDKKM